MGLPTSIESLTMLHTIMLFTNHDEPPINSRAFQTLARTLPVFRGLVRMHLTLRREQDVFAIGRSLRAWPLPNLIVNRHPHTNEHASPQQEMFNWNLKDYQQKLTLLPEAIQWEDATILEY